METLALYTDKYAKLLPTLNERARRLVVGADAKILGYGGKTLVHKASGLDYKTIRRGMRELEEKIILPKERSRTKGGGRKNITEIDPTITLTFKESLTEIREAIRNQHFSGRSKHTDSTNGTCKERSHCFACESSGSSQTRRVSPSVKLQEKEGLPNPDRDQQFRHINAGWSHFDSRRTSDLCGYQKERVRRQLQE